MVTFVAADTYNLRSFGLYSSQRSSDVKVYNSSPSGWNFNPNSYHDFSETFCPYVAQGIKVFTKKISHFNKGNSYEDVPGHTLNDIRHLKLSGSVYNFDSSTFASTTPLLSYTTNRPWSEVLDIFPFNQDYHIDGPLMKAKYRYYTGSVRQVTRQTRFYWKWVTPNILAYLHEFASREGWSSTSVKRSAYTVFYEFDTHKDTIFNNGITKLRFRSTYKYIWMNDAFGDQYDIWSTNAAINAPDLSGIAWTTTEWFSSYTIPGMAWNATAVANLVSMPDPDRAFPVSDRNPEWGQLAKNAYATVKDFDGNGIALAKDLRDLRKSTQDTLRILKRLPKSRLLKAAANLFLAFHYGWKLLFSDVRELAHSLDNQAKRNGDYATCTARSQHVVGQCTYSCTYHCYYEYMAKLKSDIEKYNYLLDAELSLDNLWDMVPFSFVIDWFVDVGDACSAFENQLDMQNTHNVLLCSRSIKCSRIVTPAYFSNVLKGFHGNMTLSYYIREYSRDAVKSSLLSDDPSTGLSGHYAEAGALIVSRR